MIARNSNESFPKLYWTVFPGEQVEKATLIYDTSGEITLNVIFFLFLDSIIETSDSYISYRDFLKKESCKDWVK